MKREVSISVTAKGASEVIIDGVRFVRGDMLPPKSGPEVLVRTRSAGVYIGTLKSRSATEVLLTNARILWSWQGAFTLHAVATQGITRRSSRISVSVPEVILTEVIAIIPIAEDVDLSSTEKA